MGRDPVPETGQDERSAIEEESLHIRKLLSSLDTDKCQWQACVRTLKHLYPDSEAQVVEFINSAFVIKSDSAAQARWNMEGICEGVSYLKQFVFCGTSTHKLISEVIPDVYSKSYKAFYTDTCKFRGPAVRYYKLVQENRGLAFTLDTVPRHDGHLNLENGRFRGLTGSIRLKDDIFPPYGCVSADTSLAEELSRCTDDIRSSIKDFVRFEKGIDKYRLYQPENGVWTVVTNEVPTLLLIHLLI